MKKAFSLLTFLFFIFTISAQKSPEEYGINPKHLPVGLDIGSKAPNFTVFGVDNKEISLSELNKEQSVVVLFYRGQWCPVCTKHLSNLNDSLQYILDKQAVVIAIGPETIENVKKTESKTKASFILAADTSLKTLKNYDVLFSVTEKYQKMIRRFLFTSIAENNKQQEAQLPIPATYVINKDGIIVYKQFDYNYDHRASVKEILQHLK